MEKKRPAATEKPERPPVPKKKAAEKMQRNAERKANVGRRDAHAGSAAPARRKASGGTPFYEKFTKKNTPESKEMERLNRELQKREERRATSKPSRAGHPPEAAPLKARHQAPPPPTAESEPMRLNKYIAHSGICARRQAAEYVKQGLVKVNDQVETNPGYLVQPKDKVRYRDLPVQPEEKRVYILMNKPKDVITTSNDEKGRKTVLDIVARKIKERIFPVGRLDRMTTGLLLLTNDGDLAKKLSHPSHKVQKFYQVTLSKNLHKDDLEKIRKGIMLEDGLAEVDGIDFVAGKKDEVGIELHTGKNRIIRRIFETLGYEVMRLDRMYYAGLTKKDIGRGHFRHLTEQEVIMLKHFK